MATLTKTEKVLVLSKDARACHAATAALSKSFSVYATPCNERDVTKFITKMRPDLVICDFSLLQAASAAVRLISNSHLGPIIETDADTTTIELDSLEKAPPILVFLEDGQQHHVLEVFELGAEDYILVPVMGDELFAKVESLMAKHMPSDSKTTSGRRSPGPVPAPILDEDYGHEAHHSYGSMPKTLGRYDIQGIVGQGGYGVVYKALDRESSRVVALKMLPKEAGKQPESVARFFRESTALRRLDHPNVVRFFEFDSFDGRFYYTMELVKGIDLKDLSDQESPLDLFRAANFVAQVAKGLQALSRLGFVHRDVKPENMILCRDGTVKLIDFGLVKMLDEATITCANDVLGTPYYMAPEYISGGTDLDERYDIYSLGVTFYVLLTGCYPFKGRNTAHVLEKHLREKPPHARVENPNIPEVIDRLIVKMLQKKPAQRPSTKALLEELERLFGPRVWQPL